MSDLSHDEIMNQIETLFEDLHQLSHVDICSLVENIIQKYGELPDDSNNRRWARNRVAAYTKLGEVVKLLGEE